MLYPKVRLSRIPDNFIVFTLEPEQVIPSHDCPQGSPFWDTQFVNWGGEFMVV
uniref:Uncharacterized protein n=1 Tax=Arundo donax TaxID=35708 RepID=A0A0A9FU88_ARUDO